MQKMGWEEGKGLGATEQGITENLKVKFKGDSKGIGYNNNDYDNVWLDHQDDYEKLLKDLGTSNDHQAVSSKTTEQVQTLELNSKSSKARLHYKKFTKSKDLSNASLNDLNCILGKEKRQKIAAIQSSMEPIVEKTEQEKKEVDETNGGLFSTNKLSVSDYFASKMAARLNKKEETKPEDSSSSPRSFDEDIPREEFRTIDEDEDPPKKTKKKKSKKHDLIETPTEALEKEVEIPKKKKAKKEECETNDADCTDETSQEKKIDKSDCKNFNGSSLFNIYGYSPYHINANFKEILNYKIKKSNKKREWTEKILKNDEKFYEMNKKKSC